MLSLVDRQNRIENREMITDRLAMRILLDYDGHLRLEEIARRYGFQDPCMGLFGFKNIANLLTTQLRIWMRRMRKVMEARRLYAPGGPGYLQARTDFMIRAGQRRATRSAEQRRATRRFIPY